MSVLLLAACLQLCALVVYSGGSIFWVAPDVGQCRELRPCQTLDSYAKVKSSLFSTSNAKWIFLPGNHKLTRKITIKGAVNITWTGDYECLHTNACTRLTPDMNSAPVLYTTSYYTEILFTNSAQVSLSYLKIVALANFGYLKLTDVDGFTLSHVNISKWEVLIFHACGNWDIQALFTKGSIDHEDLGIIVGGDKHRVCDFSFNITDSYIFGMDFILEGKLHKYIFIKIYNSTFTMPLRVIVNTLNLDFSCTKCTFSDMATTALEVQITYRCYSKINVKLVDSRFSNATGVLIAIAPYPCGERPSPHPAQQKLVSLQNVEFVNNIARETKNLLNFISDKSHLSSNEQYLSRHEHMLIIANCTFQNNQLFHHQINITNFNPATFDGYVLISHNDHGGGLYIDTTVMEVKGQVDITDNVGSKMNSGLRLYYSHIEYFTGAQLRIVNNEGFGIFIDDDEPFEFIFLFPSKGALSRPSLVVLDNYITTQKNETFPGNQIYNGHWCGNHSTSNSTTRENNWKDYVELESWDRSTVGSPPYKICLCDPSQPSNVNTWNCDDGAFNEYLYPGTEVFLPLLTIDNCYFEQPSVVTVSISDVVKPQYTQTISECTSIPLHRTISTSQLCVSVTAKDRLGNDNIRKERQFCIQAFGHCPVGLQIMVLNNTRTCVCKDILAFNGLHCYISFETEGYVTRFKMPNPHAWLGYWNGQLMFSNACPAHYCNAADNSSVFTTGLALQDINSSLLCHPSSNRQGFLCSQCPSGYSSQFGSFKCSKCSSAWVLYLLLEAVAGLGLIAFLFLFNFTVVQGDIVGITFYTNTVGVFNEFLLQHAPRTFYMVLSILNLDWRLGTCIVDGMNKFVESILTFLFPLYLLILTIAIIIAAHKFKFRIFRIQFIARRSVPVLATLMLQTYSGLVNAVIFGLQYTTVYSVDSGEEHVVWSPQPELEYFRGKHIAVGVLCLLVALFYLLPFTIVTLLGDLFRICSHNLWYIHFMDVFHGAFRYPFGFWFGSRLLLRIMFIVVSLTTSAPILAYSLFFIIGVLLLLQFLLEPFRTDNVTLYVADPQSRPRIREIFKVKISKIFRPKNIDNLYLINIVLISIAIAASGSFSSAATRVGVSLSVSLAMLQLCAVTIHHAYHYFPLPERLRRKLESLPERVTSWRQSLWRKFRVGKTESEVCALQQEVEVTYLSANMCFREDGNEDDSEDSNNGNGNEEDTGV